MAMSLEEFNSAGHHLIDWMTEYYRTIEERRVLPDVQPGDIRAQFESNPPEDGVLFTDIFRQFRTSILPGMTQWQHPNFHGYFPANSSYESVLAEMITATLGAQCMSWLTSPAATELEEVIAEWVREMMHLPLDWVGHIQDTASTATLCAIISAREKQSGFEVNNNGFRQQRMIAYCSEQAHSSIEKDVKIAGFGRENLRLIPVDDQLAMRSDALEEQIQRDIEAGHLPTIVVSAVGTTGTTAVDPIAAISAICQKYGVWHHVDAAYAGSAFVLDEYRWITDQLLDVDSYVFNPHKWLFTNFDCSMYYVRDAEMLVKTFEILPEYLKTQASGVKNFRDWGIPLGRRFRALKLWVVINSFGVAGIRERIRNHIDYAAWLETQIEADARFEMVTKRLFNLVCFRLRGDHSGQRSEQLMNRINASGMAFLSHTKVNGQYIIRLVTGQTYVQQYHVENVWRLIQQTADDLD